jgi:predicted Zn-dependent peptidase
LARVTRPDNGALVLIGDLPQDALVGSAEKWMGSWTASEKATPAREAVRAPLGAPHSLLVLEGRTNVPGGAKAWWGCRLPDAATPQGQALARLTSVYLSSVLFKRLREDLATTYASTANLQRTAGGETAIQGTFDISGKSAPAHAMFSSLFNGGGRGQGQGQRAVKVDERALETARWAIVRNWNAGLVNPRNRAGIIFDRWRRNELVEDLAAPVKAVVDVSAADVEASIATCMGHGVLALAEGLPQ